MQFKPYQSFKIISIRSSLIYKLGASSRFTIHQQISTLGARDVHFFEVGSTHYLLIAEQDHVSLHAWNADTEQFSQIQEIRADNAYHVHTYLATNGVSK